MPSREPPHVRWNKGKLTGQKPPLKLKEIWAIRVRLQLSHDVRDLAPFNSAIDSKRGHVTWYSYVAVTCAM